MIGETLKRATPERDPTEPAFRTMLAARVEARAQPPTSHREYVEDPLSIWIGVAIAATIRFLAYLDARIRQEGWEVELMIRAEASRLHERRMLGMQ